MVAGTRQTWLSVPVDPSDRGTGGAVVRFTVSNVQTMLRQRILPEDASTELLDGIVFRKDRAAKGEDISVHGARHSLCVSLLANLSAQINSARRHVRSQLPIVCDEINAPEPDFAIVRGTPRNYQDGLPAATDAYCVIEVSDSSLERDAERKLAIYSRAGIPQYFIVNLRNDTVERYSDVDAGASTYRTKITLVAGQYVSLQVDDDAELSVAVSDILP